MPAVLGYLLGGAQGLADSLVLIEASEIRGLAVTRPRRLAWGGASLAAMHLGPIAVSPGHQGRGLGRRLLEGVADKARHGGVDLLTLTTLESGDAGRLYARLGFRTVSRRRPLLRSLEPGPKPEGAALGWPGAWPAPAPRPNLLVEQGPLPGAAPSMLRPWHVRAGGGEALTIRWPVLRGGGDWGWSTQLIAARGLNPTLLDAVAARAAADGSAALWTLPELAPRLPGFEAAEPGMARMLMPLTARGREAMAAQGYVSFGPAG